MHFVDTLKEKLLDDSRTIMYHKFYCYTAKLNISIFQLEGNVSGVIGQNSLTPQGKQNSLTP